MLMITYEPVNARYFVFNADEYSRHLPQLPQYPPTPAERNLYARLPTDETQHSIENHQSIQITESARSQHRDHTRIYSQHMRAL
ncbi:uncharacterized protein B0H18DRAFT_601537 [Fomitopsis serialis]|uniref:uncharacterized protein n=1 Tax=Fomitopsis serialis TaxID=139415 RepID=UPI002007F382|nr:uncharacterized protein B0H18DRAFT_601537 [Neoantrodia serialis]KAH9933792.1 hypothetical protein B0H18DRAFT_601537 [Neoantrodia serialis]